MQYGNNPPPPGQGGRRGGGYGRGAGFWGPYPPAWGSPWQGWGPGAYYGAWPPPPPPPEVELQMLKDQEQYLSQALEDIRERIKELEAEVNR